MSTILNSISQVIANNVKVEVKSPTIRNGRTKFPVLVTDVSPSVTSGWYIQYNPEAYDNNTVLRDGSESFSELNIARFSELYKLIMTANHYFLQGYEVVTLANGKRTATYETNGVRLTASGQQNSVFVYATITDETSPFFMLSIPFTVTLSKINVGEYYIIGTDDNRWDKNTDTFKDRNAYFAPGKSRFFRVHQQQNGPAQLNGVKIAINAQNQYEINQDGTFNIDLGKSAKPEYIQVISSEYKALAYIYEQAIMKHAFTTAIAQGLPASTPQAQPGNNNMNAQANAGFVPAFTLPGVGAPNPQGGMQATPPTQIAPPPPAPAFNNTVPVPVDQTQPPVAPNQAIVPAFPNQQQPTGTVAPPASGQDLVLPWAQS